MEEEYHDEFWYVIPKGLFLGFHGRRPFGSSLKCVFFEACMNE